VKDIQIVLVNPCSEQWDEMQEVDSGRHCESCKKDIYDLTASSDAELVAFFKNKKDNVCGRMLSSQLNRTLIVPPATSNWRWLVPFAITAVAMTPAKAQNLKPVKPKVENSPSRQPINSLQEPSPVAQRLLSGTVVDTVSGRPLAGVRIKQSGFQNVLAITDSTGKFELYTDKVNMIVPCIFDLFGETTARAYLKDNMTVRMATPKTVRLGGVAVLPGNQQPLYIIFSGKKTCTLNLLQFNSLVPDWIESVNVLKGTEATAAYGSKAINGVIVIGIKKAFEDRFEFSKAK
jgi:TonB-dependent SusC/RagA subfamily outer membrane receptor